MNEGEELLRAVRAKLLYWRDEYKLDWGKQFKGFTISEVGMHMRWLFNYNTYYELADRVHAGKDPIEKLRCLCGPHGYAYYKILILRRQDASK